MSHKSIRLLFEDTAKSLRDDLQYNYARTSDFNVLRDKKYPFVNCDHMTAQPEFSVNGVSNLSKAWTGNMAFYQLDKEESTPEEQAAILDEMDGLVDKFMIKINFFSFKADKIIVRFGQQQPFIKATADILTGYLLPVTVIPEDDFDYCKDDINCILTDECGNNINT